MAMPLSSSGPEYSEQPDEIVESVGGNTARQFRGLAATALGETVDRLVVGGRLAPTEPIQRRLLLGLPMGFGGLLQELDRSDTL